jgi:hypothetical protein
MRLQIAFRLLVGVAMVVLVVELLHLLGQTCIKTQPNDVQGAISQGQIFLPAAPIGTIYFPKNLGLTKPLPANALHAADERLKNANIRLQQKYQHRPAAKTLPSTICEQRALRFNDQLAYLVSRANKADRKTSPLPIAFTITDQTYSDMADDVAAMMYRVGFPASHLFFVCLDQASLSTVCATGLHEAIFYPSKRKNTRVSEAKFGVAEQLLIAGRSFLFFEMDVWFIRAPLPYFTNPDADLFIGLHQNNAFSPNIGFYFARPVVEAMSSGRDGNGSSGVASAARDLFHDLLAHTLRQPSHFDQQLMQCLLRGTSQQFQHPSFDQFVSGAASKECTQLGLRMNWRWRASRGQGSTGSPHAVDGRGRSTDPSDLTKRGCGGGGCLSRVRWAVLDPNAFIALEDPQLGGAFAGRYVGGHGFVSDANTVPVVSVHILSAIPLSGAYGKRYQAKELGLWEGAHAYYQVGAVGGGSASGANEGGASKHKRYISYEGVFGGNGCV